MFRIDGKCNHANVFIDNIDQSTFKQIMELCNVEAYKDCKIRIMPDCHAGSGCVIGTTMEISNNVVSPNLVGVDIGCGVLTSKLDVKEIDFAKLDAVIREYVPSGFNCHDKNKFNFNFGDKLLCADFIDVDHAERSIGTLGGGNHFIEIDRAGDGTLFLIIHSGSRKGGLEVCKIYQEMAVSDAKFNVAKELMPISGENYNNYVHDMKVMQEFAALNRKSMQSVICAEMGFNVVEQWDTIHNYIDFSSAVPVLRKGAVSAKKDEILTIPLNMRDGSIICKGLGNPEWNSSAPHGAGRILSRASAKKQLNVESFAESMKGIYSSCITESRLDESPEAYKNADAILGVIGETVEIIEVIKPIYNFKA